MILTLCTITCNELEALKRMLEPLKGNVDDYVIGVDDKTTDGTFEWLSANGYKPYHFHFENFSQVRNLGMAKVKTPWILIMDSDEMILPQHAVIMRDLCRQGSKFKFDAYSFVRHHWFDLERTKPWNLATPDIHPKLVRSHLRFEGKVHEQMTNIRNCKFLESFESHHFNNYYRDAKAWEEKNLFYKKLSES